jgi:hypothetical protein
MTDPNQRARAQSLRDSKIAEGRCPHRLCGVRWDSPAPCATESSKCPMMTGEWRPWEASP